MKDAKIYVGTYAKYNNGSIAGKWLDLSDYDNIDEFYEACAELHNDEDDPEFMFQDWEGIPESLISESWLSDNFFDLRDTVGEYEEEAFYAYCNHMGHDLSTEDAQKIYNDFQEAYQGQYDSDEDFAQTLADELGYMKLNMGWPYTCIDWEYAAREIMYDYFSEGNFYFRSI